MELFCKRLYIQGYLTKDMLKGIARVKSMVQLEFSISYHFRKYIYTKKQLNCPKI